MKHNFFLAGLSFNYVPFYDWQRICLANAVGNKYDRKTSRSIHGCLYNYYRFFFVAYQSISDFSDASIMKNDGSFILLGWTV